MSEDDSDRVSMSEDDSDRCQCQKMRAADWNAPRVIKFSYQVTRPGVRWWNEVLTGK